MSESSSRPEKLDRAELAQRARAQRARFDEFRGRL
jgi:hypothetical protein